MSRRRRLPLLVLLLVGASCGGGATPEAAAPEGAAASATRRTVLITQITPDSVEEEDFGCYSYVLYRTAPTANSLRDVALFTALLAHPTAGEVSLEYEDRYRYNLTSIPEKEFLWDRDSKKWIDGYYLGGAIRILDAQVLNHKELLGVGPFIVSSKEPLQWAPAKRTIAILDLSGAQTPESADAWVRFFVDNSERPQDWATLALEKFLLRLHDSAVPLGSAVNVLPNKDAILKVFSIGSSGTPAGTGGSAGGR